MYDCDEGLRQARRPLVLKAYASSAVQEGFHAVLELESSRVYSLGGRW